MLEQREKVLKITTGSSTLDQMLGGGIESAAITGQHPAETHSFSACVTAIVSFTRHTSCSCWL